MKYLSFEDIILKKINANESVLPKEYTLSEANDSKQLLASERTNYHLNFSEAENNLKTILGFC
jgi:hypothetical protein